MTRMGLAFRFSRKKRQKKKSNTSPQFMVASEIGPSGQNAEIRMEMPAEAIKATTAGLREDRTLCRTAILRYFRYSRAMTVTMIQDGRMQPKVAATAPGMPAILMPTKVAELIAIGPGVIWEIVIRSVNSFIESQWCRETT